METCKSIGALVLKVDPVFGQHAIHEQEGDIQAAAIEYWKYLDTEPDGAEAGVLKKRLAEWMAEGMIEVQR